MTQIVHNSSNKVAYLDIYDNSGKHIITESIDLSDVDNPELYVAQVAEGRCEHGVMGRQKSTIGDVYKYIPGSSIGHIVVTITTEDAK